MRRTLRALLLGLCVLAPALVAGEPPAEAAGAAEVTADVIYGRKYALALTMDVYRPAKPSGSAVVFVVSGGWFSSKGTVRAYRFDELLARGHTVFAVLHGSQPKFAIPEIVPDVHRAVRYVRRHAKRFGIDPQRIGIMGTSAGGHLSLLVATRSEPGRADAVDPVERVSSRVQAVAAFFPPTDFLNWGDAGQSLAELEVATQFRAAFDFKRFDAKTGTYVRVEDAERIRETLAEVSPLTHVSADDPPALLIHGTADRLVPIQQSEVMFAKLERAGVPARLVVREGKGHGWTTMAEDLALVAEWFAERLSPKR